MSNTNDVDTQDELLNTETDLDNDDEFENDNIEDDSSNEHEADGSNESGDDDGVDIFSLNDEEFAKYVASGKVPKESKQTVKKDNENEPVTRTTDKSSTTSDESVPDSKNSGHTKSFDSKQEKTNKRETERKGSESTDNSKTGSTSETTEVDYKAAYESIFKPFKANGKEITPRTAEDVISLMQMGANYTKKMQLMAPMRKTFESLNRADINDADLNFLIDLHKGNKEAIKKLLEKHKVDPIDLNMDETDYVPNNNIVSEEDAEYSEILSDIESSLPKIQEIMTSKWDSKSKTMLLKDHKLMKALHEEIEMGRFDEVQSRLEIEKTFGRYKNVSDLEAYIDLVTKMVNESQSSTNNQKQVSKSTNTSNKNTLDKSKAAPTKAAKTTAQGSQLTAEDIFSMSEEEFSKLSKRHLI